MIAVELSQHEFEIMLAGLHSQLSRVRGEADKAKGEPKARLLASYDVLRLRYDQLDAILDSALAGSEAHE